MNKAAVIENHTSKYPNPIKFKIGDNLNVGDCDTEYKGWVKVTAKDGNVGWAPFQYLSKNEKKQTAIATHDYFAVELIKELNGWCWVKNSCQNSGWVPAHALQPI